MIENDEADSYSAGTTRETGGEAEGEEYCLEKRPRQEDDSETVPKKFMMPPMAAYDGTGNPREHVLNYKTFMKLQTLSDALMCKVFPTTLSGPARAWFNNLEAGSINSFGDLATRFISRFISGVPADRKTSYLETIRKPPTSLAELMKRAEKYIRQDDALVTSRFARGLTDKRKALEEKRLEKHERKHGGRPEPYKQPWERRDQRPLPSQDPVQRSRPSWVPEKPTPLNASRAEVLIAVQDKEFLQWPRPLRAEADQRNPDKYCQYHRTHGHDTNNYFQLIAEIERLIKRGHLKNFVKKPEGQRPPPTPTV
ncbi:uncharacterized protein LOC110608934 [Manihot esculenta]|uniref:uncharacterized protein LOC110608934 n=1 Tax=Manihot esculenta TaxID=3983 RepID=UPI001CC339D1|nr:uncharacterized protein LOC110608934 [Manihot esculenta]